MSRGPHTTPARRRRVPIVLAVVALLAVTLAACGSSGKDDAKGAKAVTIGWIPWDEDIAVTHLWKALLEEKGYQVKLTQVDAAPLFQSMADGDIDLFFDGWLPNTHADYWEAHEADLEKLGVWYDSATLNLAVPDYVDIDSIADLKGKASEFDKRIVGIEPGAGLMRITGDDVLPGYGLDDYTLLEGSSPTMLVELETAIKNKEPIVVTLWHPHWAYAKFPIKDLKDPEGLLGKGEEINTIANKGWAKDHPEVAQWMGKFALDDQALGTLEDLVLNKHKGDEAAGVKEWLADKDNRALADSWFA